MSAIEKVNIKFDEDALTLGDLEDFEDVVGISLFEAIKPVNVKDDEGNTVKDEKGRPVQTVNLTAKALKALVWITMRIERPGFSLEDARNVKVAALEIESKGDTEGNGEAAPEGEATTESVTA